MNKNIEIPIEYQVSGEFEITIKRSDGTIRQHIPKQKNLITNNGLKSLTGTYGFENRKFTTSKGLEIIPDQEHSYYGLFNTSKTFLLIGSGNAQPQKNDIKLGKYLFSVRDISNISNITATPPTTELPTKYSFEQTYTYIFQGIEGHNLTELGLAFIRESMYQYHPTQTPNPENQSHYVLLTHALIKNSEGHPAAITLQEGEILEIAYTFKVYYDVSFRKSKINITTIPNLSEPENVSVKEYDMAIQGIYPYWINPNGNTPSNFLYLVPDDLSQIENTNLDMFEIRNDLNTLPLGVTNETCYLNGPLDTGQEHTVFKHWNTQKELISKNLNGRFSIFEISDRTFNINNISSFSNEPRLNNIFQSNIGRHFVVAEEGLKTRIKYQFSPYLKDYPNGFRAFLFGFNTYFNTYSGVTNRKKLNNSFIAGLRGSSITTSSVNVPVVPPIAIWFNDPETNKGIVKPQGYRLDFDIVYTVSEYEG